MATWWFCVGGVGSAGFGGDGKMLTGLTVVMLLNGAVCVAGVGGAGGS